MKQTNNHPNTLREPIAIVGMACRFPQANTLQEFWNLLQHGRDTVTEIPKTRWDNDLYYDPDTSAVNKSHQRHASMLDNIHDFDPLFFNISPAEAIDMSPSQKLMLELVWESIENSTIPLKDVKGKKVGVYVGNIWNDFEHLRKHKNAQVTSHAAVGQSSNIIANRVSFAFGLTGPSLVMDTGCSSALVALHLACQSIWEGETEMSIAAGVNHILDPDQNVLLSKFGGLSKKGKCSTFDIEADGFVRGEGAGVLIIKKLADAERDGDKIYALIRGTAINNNGFNVNLPATSIEGQKSVLREAYAQTDLAPEKMHYVEAHGTGTKLGDPTETRALGEFFNARRTEGKLRIGSVKTNIGHLEAAAGMAGLMKVVLSMQHKMLPPSLNFKTPNPNIAFDELKLEVQSSLGAWPATAGETLKAGINSFGWGGTNAHTIIEEYKPAEKKLPEAKQHSYVLSLSARTAPALKDYAKTYLTQISNLTETALIDFCIATALLKPEFEYRASFTGTSKNDLVKSIEDFLTDESVLVPCLPTTGADKTVFVFPGQGSQWLGMGKDLYQRNEAFRKSIDACETAFRAYTDWSLLEQLHATEETSRLQQIDVIQPALCAVQIALAQVWISWGMRPDAVAGHSMGEVAAAHVAGILTLDDAARIICTRSKLMKRVSGQGGAMLVTELTVQEAQDTIARYPELSVAVSNSPKSTVLAGNKTSIEALQVELESKNIFCRPVKVDVASHSKQMDPLKVELRQALQGIRPQAGTYRLFSTVLNREVNGLEMNADYWVNNLRGTVEFASVMKQLLEVGHTTFIESSPHPVLLNAIGENAEFNKVKIRAVASTFRDKPEEESVLKNFGELYTKGLSINWKTFFQADKAPAVTLPHYPFQRERYELEDRSAEREGTGAAEKFPLLGSQIVLADTEHVHYWESELSIGKFPFLSDHQVNNNAVFPGAGYLEVVLEAATEIYGAGVPVVRKLHFRQSITFHEREVTQVQLRVTEDDHGNAHFKFFGRPKNAQKSSWTLLADGELHIYKGSHIHTDRLFSPETPGASIDVEGYYKSLQLLGLKYESYFQGLSSMTMQNHRDRLNVSFRVEADDRIKNQHSKFLAHPAVLDACFQPLFIHVLNRLSASSDRTTYLTSIDEVQLSGVIDITKPLTGEARLYPVQIDTQRGTIAVKADLIILDEAGTVLLKVSGLKGKVFDASLIRNEQPKPKDWVYEVSWVKNPATPKLAVPRDTKTWLLLGDVYGLSSILVEKQAKANIRFIHVSPGQTFSRKQEEDGAIEYSMDFGDHGSYARLLEDVLHTTGTLDGIMHMGSIYYPSSDRELSSDDLEKEQKYGSLSVLTLLQQINASPRLQSVKLAVITNGMQRMTGDKHPPQVIHAPVQGLAKVISNELSQYEIKSYDLSFHPMMEEFDHLLHTLQQPHEHDNEFSLRGRRSYSPKLSLAKPVTIASDEYKDARFSPEGTYLITGFRGLGFVFMEWMIRQGAKHFVLLSRTGSASLAVQEKMKVYEGDGCTFAVVKADAGDIHQLREVFDSLRESSLPLRGVVHAAGVIEAKSIADISDIDFLETLKPKMKGAWNLHVLTQDMSLDCFIMFSSASSLIGLSGQASYVAANSFLDVLSHHRKHRGLPAQSINWGVMKDVGMVANEAELEKYARAEGFEPITMTEAMEVFDSVYDGKAAQQGIMKIVPSQMASYYSVLARTNYFKGLLEVAPEGQAAEHAFAVSYRALTDTRQKLDALENIVMLQVARIIKMSTSRINNTMTFKGVGVDSLMAIQLRNLLEKSLEVKLPVTMFWKHPSIREYAVYLYETLEVSPEEKLTADLAAIDVKDKSVNWFITPRPNRNATVRLFCFHDAGGSTSLFQHWENRLGASVELVLVELPGRDRQVSLEPMTDIGQVINHLLSTIDFAFDKPFVFAGHSMGGVVAFELSRALKRMGKPEPTKLFVSSTPNLRAYDRSLVDYTLSDDELSAVFPHVSSATVPDAELRQMLINILRADLKLLSNYHYKEDEALSLPIIALHGEDDPKVTKTDIIPWSLETTGSIQLITRPGGHRYLEHDADFVTSLILQELQENKKVMSTVTV